MRAPDLGSHVVVLEKPNQSALRDSRVWTVWAQSETGWHIFIRTGDVVEWDDQPARLLKPASKQRTMA